MEKISIRTRDVVTAITTPSGEAENPDAKPSEREDFKEGRDDAKAVIRAARQRSLDLVPWDPMRITEA